MKFDEFKIELESILREIKFLKQQTDLGNDILWTKQQIEEIVEPEIVELYSYANKGVVYFKYGKKQRRLESSYCLTDSLQNLNSTDLGLKIINLQEIYNRL